MTASPCAACETKDPGLPGTARADERKSRSQDFGGALPPGLPAAYRRTLMVCLPFPAPLRTPHTRQLAFCFFFGLLLCLRPGWHLVSPFLLPCLLQLYPAQSSIPFDQVLSVNLLQMHINTMRGCRLRQRPRRRRRSQPRQFVRRECDFALSVAQ